MSSDAPESETCESNFDDPQQFTHLTTGEGAPTEEAYLWPPSCDLVAPPNVAIDAEHATSHTPENPGASSSNDGTEIVYPSV